MENWKKLSDLLEEESKVWQKIFAINQEKMEIMSKDMFSKEVERLFIKKEKYLEEIFRIQREIDVTQLQIEMETEQVNSLLRYRIETNICKIKGLQGELESLEKKYSESLAKCGEQMRGEIKQYRVQRKVNDNYGAFPILEESALLDEKK